MAERFDEKPGVTHSGRKRDAAAAGGRTTEQDPVLDLQRQAGNRAVSEMLQGGAAGQAKASPALRLRDALRAGRGVVQRELSLNVQRDLKSDTEEKEDPAEAKSQPFEEKMPSDSAEKLGGEDKEQPIGLKPFPGDEDKMPGGEEKMPSDSTDKVPSGEEKMPSGEEKMPSDDEEKMPSDSTDKVPGDEDKVFDDEEKLS
jgi:hypothetical protein